MAKAGRTWPGPRVGADGLLGRPLRPECFPLGARLSGDRSWEKLASQLQTDRNLMGNEVHTE